jgi:hypothetical protein
MSEETRPKRRRIVLAPAPSNPQLRSTVQNVQCTEDEEVEWQWTETPEGRIVTGYRIVSAAQARLAALAAETAVGAPPQAQTGAAP